jgi:CspA family cold shock protein
MISTVKSWNSKLGFGFIVNPVEGKEDIFVHYSGIIGQKPVNLVPGETVEFETELTHRGVKAVQVIRSRQPVGTVSRQAEGRPPYYPQTRE